MHYCSILAYDASKFYHLGSRRLKSRLILKLKSGDRNIYREICLVLPLQRTSTQRFCLATKGGVYFVLYFLILKRPTQVVSAHKKQLYNNKTESAI